MYRQIVMTILSVMMLVMGTVSMAQAQQFCGGSDNGNYQQNMEPLSKYYGYGPALSTTGGPMNLRYLQEGKCVAAPAQMDSYLLFKSQLKGTMPKFVRVAGIGEEYAHLVCADYVKFPSVTGRLASIRDLAGRRDLTIAIGQPESGSYDKYMIMMTVLHYLRPENGGPQVNTDVDPTSQRTLTTVKSRTNGKLDCLFFVSSLNSKAMKRINEQGASLELLNIDDPALLNLTDQWGTPVYEIGYIQPNTYSNLQSSRYSLLYSQQPVKTTKVRSVLFADERWYYSNPRFAQLMAEWIKKQNLYRY